MGNPMVLELAQRLAGRSKRPLLWLSGHEHNFQHHQYGRLHSVLTGAAGKVSKLLKKSVRAAAESCCHCSVPHFLLVTVTPNEIRIRAIDEEGTTAMLTSCRNTPRHDEEEIVIRA